MQGSTKYHYSKLTPYVHLLFNAPQFNPIQIFFGMLKQYTRSREPRTEAQLLSTILDFQKNFDTKKLVSCLSRSLSFYKKALKKVFLSKAGLFNFI